MTIRTVTFNGGLTYTGLYLVNDWLASTGYGMLPSWFSTEYKTVQLDPINDSFIGRDGERIHAPIVYRGKLQHRIAQYQHKAYGRRLNKRHHANHLGMLVARHSRLEGEIIPYDITHKVCSWRPGDFGEDSESCYWEEYTSSPVLIVEAGGFSIRVYDPATMRGVGRAHCLRNPSGDGYVVFNGYLRGGVFNHVVDEPTLFMAQVLTKILSDRGNEYYYWPIRPTNFGEKDGPLYFNDGYAWAVSMECNIDNDDVDFRIDASAWVHCDFCNRYTPYDGSDTIGTLVVCEDCISGLVSDGTLAECDHCGSLRAINKMYTFTDDGERWCEPCIMGDSQYRQLIFRCEECDRLYTGSHMEYDNKPICNGCVELLGLKECGECGDLTRDRLEAFDDNGDVCAILCNTCSRATTCKVCHTHISYTSMQFHVLGTHSLVCEKCLRKEVGDGLQLTLPHMSDIVLLRGNNTEEEAINV